MDLSEYNSSNTTFLGVSGLQCYARLVDVHDGDTVTVIAETFPGIVFRFHIRLMGMDAPEMTSKVLLIKELAEKARTRLVSLLVPSPLMYPHTGHLTRLEMIKMLEETCHLIYIRCMGLDKYGRVLAEIAKDAVSSHAGYILVQEGLAKRYNGGTKQLFEPLVLQTSC